MPDAASATAPLAVEWAGCAVVRGGPQCLLGMNRTLIVWLGGDVSAIEWATDLGPAIARREADVMGGTRLSIDVPARARWLHAQAAGGAASWSLSLGDAPSHDEVDDLLAAGKKGDAESAATKLAEIATSGAPELRGPAKAAYGRLELARGNVAVAERALREAMDIAHREGRLSDEVRDGSALFWALVELEQRFADARRLLNEIRPAGEAHPEGKAFLAYNEGLLALAMGDQRRALASYRTAERTAQRLDQRKLAGNAGEELARILGDLGRSDEALALLSRVPADSDRCSSATSKLNRGWIMMEASGRNRRTSDPAIWSALQEARSAAASCGDPHRRAVTLINAAEYALDVGDDAAAAALTAELSATKPPIQASTASWRADVFGRWALRRGEPARARIAFAEELAIARAGGLWQEAFRGEVGLGRAMRASGRNQFAVARLKSAQTLLEQMVGGVPLAEGRGAFLRGHDDAVRFLVEALVDQGETREALRTARLACAAALSYAIRADRLTRLSVEERSRWDELMERYMRVRHALESEAEQDWKLSRADVGEARAAREVRAEEAHEDLDRGYRLLVGRAHHARINRAITLGELELTIFPSSHGWLGFAATAAGISVRRFPDGAVLSVETAAEVLAAFSAELASARRVRMMAYGAANRINWHAVSWRGQPLIFAADIEYELGLGEYERVGRESERALTALLVSNPTGDLPSSAVEVAAAAQALAGWRITRLAGASASRDALLSELARVSLFHFAGHAEFAGTDGVSSALLLAHGARVEVGDIMATSHLPSVVVLSACEAAATGSEATSALGLAQIFVASGARAAIAPTSAIGDEESRQFVTAFYAALAADSEIALAAAFRRAAMAGGREAQGWRAFRLMSP